MNKIQYTLTVLCALAFPIAFLNYAYCQTAETPASNAPGTAVAVNSENAPSGSENSPVNSESATPTPAAAEPTAPTAPTAPAAPETAASTAEAAPEPTEELVPSEPEITHQRESTDIVFRLSKQEKEEIDKLAVQYVDLSVEKIHLEAQQEYYQSEIEKLTQAAESASALNLFLADFGSFARQRRSAAKSIGILLKEELQPLGESMRQNEKHLKTRSEQMHQGWKEMRRVRWENESLNYELESGAKIVAQAASLLSMDKRWFWLAGLIGFVVLFAVVLHERRREIRRWLNGGRARKMRLSKVLFGFIIFLACATFVTFLYGDAIYRALLDVTVSGVTPQTEFSQKIDSLKKEVDELQVKLEEQKAELRNARKALSKPFKDVIPKETESEIGEELYQALSEYRIAVVNSAIYAKKINGIIKLFKEDREVMDSIYAANQKFSKQAAKYLRLKHAIRAGLGVALLGLLAWGLLAFFRSVMQTRYKFRNTCPMCLTEGEMQVLSTPEEYAKASQKYHLDPQSVPAPEPDNATVLCCHEITSKPKRFCNYSYGGKYQRLPKLSVPTLGVPQAGKTFWMTMLYWQLSNGYSCQSKDMSIIPSPATRDLDFGVHELVEQRRLLPATQRDRIPFPVMFEYTDHDSLGRTKLLTSVFDYSGEVTTDVAAEDYRRQRALASDAFLFFLDPTYPWEPQAAALERFNSDLRTQKQINQWRSLRLPIALCLTKIDLLPTIQSWDDAWHKAERFYTDMEKIDPTGEGISKSIIEQRSALVDEIRKDIWPDWDLDGQIKKLFGGRHMFFPMTAVGLEGSGETDLSVRTLSPFGLAEPLFWVMEMNGYPTL